MPGKNLTGLPDPQFYSIGRGKVLGAPLSPTTGLPSGPWRDLGNSPDFKIGVTEETLKHQSSIQGLKVTDKEVVISQELNVTLSLDEINNENLAILFSGEEASNITNPSKTAVAVAQNIAADGELVAGRWYELKNAAGARLFDITAADLTVVTDEGTPVTLALTDDYLLDLEFGLIFFLTTSTKVTTCIAATKTATFTTTAMASARDIEVTRALTQTSIPMCIKFLSENPANQDVRAEFQFHKISLKANGDFSLIGDAFTTMTFTGVAEANTAIDVNSPTLTVKNLKAA